MIKNDTKYVHGETRFSRSLFFIFLFLSYVRNPFRTHLFPFYSPLLLSTIPSSAFNLPAHLPHDFFLSALSLFFYYPSFSFSLISQFPKTDSLYLFPLFLFPATYQSIILIYSSPFLTHLLEFHPPPLSLSLFNPFFLDETPTRCSFYSTLSSSPRPVSCSLSDPFALCPPLSRVAPGPRVSLCASSMHARKIHVGVTPNARYTRVCLEFMDIFSIQRKRERESERRKKGRREREETESAYRNLAPGSQVLPTMVTYPVT